MVQLIEFTTIDSANDWLKNNDVDVISVTPYISMFRHILIAYKKYGE